MGKLTEGQRAPDFSSVSHDGRPLSLSGYRGKKLVLYFYPKNGTPGCTAEACNLRDNYEDLLKQGFSILGVSPDTEASHARFAAKHGLPFPLIADPGKEILRSYGVWGEKTTFGKKVMGVIRTTFIISEDGIIEKIISDVNTRDHASQIFKIYKH